MSALATILRIAVNVFRESVRDKVLYNLVFFALLLIAASILIGQLTAGQEVKIIKDLGLAATSVFGLFIAVFIGIGLVSKEVERRSVYGLLVKPISRPQFVVGKYCGLVLTLAVNLSIMAVALYAVLAWMAYTSPEGVRASWEARALDPAMLKALLLVFAQLALVTAVALFFSTFSSPLLSAAITFGLFVIGHFNADLRNFENVIDSAPLAWLLRVLYYVLPNLAPFDVKAQVVHAQPVPWGYIGMTIGYGILYVGAVLAGAVWVFSRRDFK
jgi:ABC-type transport system involved in multi-copper enzyme maturation permease subunit